MDMIGIRPKPPPIRGIERYRGVVEDNELIRAYLAGVVDSSSSISVHVQKEDSFGLGYTIQPVINVRKKDPGLPELFAYWGEQIGVKRKVRHKQDYYSWTVTGREAVGQVLECLEPYLLIYDGVAETILQEIIPRLEDREHTTKEGFLRIMEFVDDIRRQVSTRGKSQYDVEYFEDLWADEMKT